MKITSIKELFLDTMNSIFDIEQQLTVALPRMAEASSTPELRQAFEQHLNETREHVDRAQQIFKQIGERPGRKPNLVLEGMTQGVEELIGNLDEGPLRDAALIMAGNQIEHFEMTFYGSLRTFATLFGNKEIAALLEKTLDEEKRADSMLTEIAEQQVNLRAIHEEAASSVGRPGSA